MASGHQQSAAQTGRTHGSTDQLCITVKKSLANREPSTHGYKRKFRALEIMSALPPEADIQSPKIDFCFTPAASTDRCNTSVESFCRRFELQCFAWPFV